MINSYSEFQPLKEVVVGQGYPPDYFDFIDDLQTRETLQQIFFEINEDFTNIQRTLESFGVRVVRPGIIPKKLFLDRLHQDGYATIPPIMPRDRQTVFGDKLLRLSRWITFDLLFKHYRDQEPDRVLEPQGRDCDIITEANASCVYRMGRDIWFDQSEWLTDAHVTWLKENVLTDPNYRFHQMITNGHSDCVFAVLKPGVILTCFHDAGVSYGRDFPGWNLHRVDNPSIERFLEFKEKYHPGLRWWVPNSDNKERFRTFVDQYLNTWVGEIHESVFDLNCLSIDTKHAMFACYNKEVFDYCKQNGIEPILCEIRHRFFFDGGLHCCTLDIEREGGMEDYLG